MPRTPAEMLRLRAVVAEDEAFLRKVYASTRSAELDQVPWSAEQKAAFCDMQFTAQDAHYRSNYKAARFLVIEREAEPVGRLYVDRQEDEIHIIDISLLPEYRGAGIGTCLLKGLMNEAGDAGKKVTIYVEKFNPALSLYQRLGYQHIKDHEVYNLMQWLPARAPGAESE